MMKFEIELHNNTPMVSSKDIAKEFGRDHSHVMTSIESVLNLSEIVEVKYKAGNGQMQPMFLLSERSALIAMPFIGGNKSKEGQIALVDAYLAYRKTQIVTPALEVLPAEIAQRSATALKEMYKEFGVPKSYAVQEIAKEVTRQSGIDVTAALTQSSYCTNVPETEVMLEPSDLGKLHNMSGLEFNQLLSSHDLQEKVGGQWVATGEGKSISQKHAWTTKFKSGYNLKWNAKAVEVLCRDTDNA